MNSGFRSQCVPGYRVLSEEQIREIHLATLKLLETVGVRVNHAEAIEMLRAAGCRIKPGDIVQMPNWLIEECIASAPSYFTVYNRLGEEAMHLGGRNIHYGLGTDLIRTYDLNTGELRRSCLQDVANAARVVDYCSDVDFVASFALPQEVPTNTMYVECVRTEMENTVKPVFFTAGGREDVSAVIEMAAAVVGGADKLREKPFIVHYSEPTPPLTHSFGAVDKLFLCAERGVPITYVPGAIMGASAPVTLAGGIIQCNAEALSGLVLHQLRGKGSPIISGMACVPMDMLSSTFLYGAPEFRLTNSAFSDIYHYYGLPMWSTVGTDSHVLDPQAAMEHAWATLLAGMDGGNLIHDVGYMGQGLIGNPACIVMGNEMISWVKRFLRGFEINDATKAMDVIASVGPGGNYMAEDHTLQHFRSELWRPKHANRLDPDTWIAQGSKPYTEVVTEAARNIVETHRAVPLSDEVKAAMDAIVKRTEEALKGKYFVA